MPERVASWLARLTRWVRLHPVAGSPGQAQLAEELEHALTACGMIVTRYYHARGCLLIARRTGCGPLLGVYNHYDVEPGGRTDIRVAGERVFGRGVADNLGPLALRLAVLERHARGSNLFWVIEPGEESGSHALAEWLTARSVLPVDLWLDETGYFDAGGTQRVLAVGLDARAERVVRRCARLGSGQGRETRIERRHLRRVVSDAGFNVAGLFRRAPYLALGPNDDDSDVHGEHESLPLETIELSMRQFETLLDMSSRDAGR